jgi:hypothetical protein
MMALIFHSKLVYNPFFLNVELPARPLTNERNPIHHETRLSQQQKGAEGGFVSS